MLKIKGEHASKPIQRWLRPALVAIPLAIILIVLFILQPWSPVPGPQTVMAKAYAATTSVQSYRFNLSIIYDPNDSASNAHFDAEYSAPDRYHVQMIETEKDQIEEFIVIGNKQYVKNTNMSKNMITATITGFSSLLKKETTLGYLDMLTDIQKLPDENIDGVDSFHYKGKIDVEQQIAEAKRSMLESRARLGTEHPTDEEIEKDLEHMRSGNTTFELWIGKEDYLIRQLKIERNNGLLNTSIATFKFYDFNEPITIEPPLDAQGNLFPDWQMAGIITPDSKQPVFGVNLSDSIGAEPGYNDAAHQQITFRINITNQSSETVKNVRIMLSTLATNEAQKPQVIQAEPENTGHLDFEPDQSETYNITWKFDGSNTSKQEISRLVDETTVMVKFTTQDGRELTQLLSPNVPYPTAIPPSSPPA